MRMPQKVYLRDDFDGGLEITNADDRLGYEYHFSEPREDKSKTEENEMNVNDLTIGQAKELTNMFGGNNQNTFQPFQIGKAYLIRTVTHIDIGVVVAVGPTEVVMRDVSWVADTGRYADAFKTGELSEVEPYPDSQEVIIGRGAIVDATRWTHAVPREQK